LRKHTVDEAAISSYRKRLDGSGERDGNLAERAEVGFEPVAGLNR
jgi:hypothetical protein